MLLTLTRTGFGPTSTLGNLAVDGEFQAWTLEDVPREVKIPGQTCIPEGSYDVTITMSSRFKRRMPLVNQVPNFSGIRIHSGNTSADTEGCILVGQRFNSSGDDGKDYRVDDSRAAFDALFALIDAALDRGEQVRLTITHEPQQQFNQPELLGES